MTILEFGVWMGQHPALAVETPSRHNPTRNRRRVAGDHPTPPRTRGITDTNHRRPKRGEDD